jgi:hypothetical protein
LIRENGRGTLGTLTALHEKEQFLESFHDFAEGAPIMAGNRRFNCLLQLARLLLVFFMHGTKRLSGALQGLDRQAPSL